MADTTVLVNPFPGLRPFTFDESHLFFGREGQSDALLTRLRRRRFIAVVGTSGSGKSSLVRAGLLPALYGGFMTPAGSSWRVAVLRPGNDPMGNLALALNAPDVLGAGNEDPVIHRTLIETTLRRSTLGLVDAVQQARLLSHENLLIVVDQFEELFRFQQLLQRETSDDEATAFVKLLLEATRQREVPIYIVLALRSDYLGDCAQFRDLPEAINDGQYLIPRLYPLNSSASPSLVQSPWVARPSRRVWYTGCSMMSVIIPTSSLFSSTPSCVSGTTGSSTPRQLSHWICPITKPLVGWLRRCRAMPMKPTLPCPMTVPVRWLKNCSNA